MGVGGLMDWLGVGSRGGRVVTLTANCSRQANGKQDMSECRVCITIAFKNLKAGREQRLHGSNYKTNGDSDPTRE